MYVQRAFVFVRVKALAPMHPEWKDKQPFAAVLDGDGYGGFRRKGHGRRDPTLPHLATTLGCGLICAQPNAD